jgi:cytoskeletal protein RodZ
MTESSPQLNSAQTPMDRLSEAIRAGLEDKGMSADSLVDRIRVSPDTVARVLAGESGQRGLDFMPPVYVRGHLKLIAEALDLDPEDIIQLYEQAYCQPDVPFESMQAPMLPYRTVAWTAGLGMGILAVIVAFLGG